MKKDFISYMNRKILKKLFIVFVFIFAFGSISFGENETIYKYFISTRVTEIRLYPYKAGSVIGMLNNDVRVKTLGSSSNWLLVDVEYPNLSAKSLDDINIHFNAWVNKNDFEEFSIDKKSGTDIDLKSPSILNTIYSPEDKSAYEMDKDIWGKKRKFYLIAGNTSDLFLLPNIPLKDAKTKFITNQTLFCTTGNYLSWQKQEWMEIVFYSPASGFQRLWIKKTEVISENAKKIVLEMRKKLLEIKQAENMRIEVKNLKIEIKDLKEEMDLGGKIQNIVTGNADFDKRIEELEINRKIDLLEEKLNQLDLLQDSLRAFDEKSEQ